jgi:hypothetical protein
MLAPRHEPDLLDGIVLEEIEGDRGPRLSVSSEYENLQARALWVKELGVAVQSRGMERMDQPPGGETA